MGRWVLAATILASSMAFIDGTVVAFNRELGTRLNAVEVDEQVRSSVYEQRVKLAGVEVPGHLDAQHRGQIKEAITGSYVFGFRLIMIVSAALSLASALCAWGWIGKSRPAKSRQ